MGLLAIILGFLNALPASKPVNYEEEGGDMFYLREPEQEEEEEEDADE